ncbi:MAG: 23S rRNA (guanosine(2251)-2'-O)-methyltransferase RlmB [Nitrospinota bacterium]|nr:MAG: 23S rRNA (guanosine(2251)-2'-O)-methyltransferase RlmB [Nitrospinota bacterium]
MSLVRRGTDPAGKAMGERERGGKREKAAGSPEPAQGGELLYGVHPVREALQASADRVEALYLAHGRRGAVICEILQRAAHQGIPVYWKERRELDHLTGVRTHQGVVGRVKPRSGMSLEALIRSAGPAPTTLLLVLDEIKDPRNFGSLLRSAEAFGVAGVIVPRHRAAKITATVAKAAAGASEYIPVVEVVNISRTLLELKKKGFWVVGGVAKGGDPCYTHQFREATALVLGEEGRGLRPLVQRQCDFLVTIPLSGRIKALNVAVAGGILLYEIRRQQGCREEEHRGGMGREK